jgi:hypothetical protein
MQTMRARMHEMLQTEDPVKRRELIDAQSRDMEAMMKMGQPGPGMGMMMGPGGMGPGLGMMMGQPGNPNCKLSQGAGTGMMMEHTDKCDRHDNTTDLRLDALEKRMDMMQMMMRMMMH